jgi:uncharacterized protein
MSKVQVDILGLSASQAGTNAFALILKEAHGNRRLTIVIGVPEAQAIANELEGIRPQRPMTHDLLKNTIDVLGGHVKDVVINALREGTYYAQIIFEYSGLELDSRPSDAIALAIRCGVPIYVTEDILEEAGFPSEENEDFATGDSDDEEDETLSPATSTPPASTEQVPVHLSERDRLQKELDDAITNEDYELAARLRDELQKLS